jgi:hypothetical protein
MVNLKFRFYSRWHSSFIRPNQFKTLKGESYE